MSYKYIFRTLTSAKNVTEPLSPGICVFGIFSGDIFLTNSSPKNLQVFSLTKCASFHVAAPPFSPGWLSLETQVSSPSFKTSLRFLLFLLRRGIGQMCHLGLKNNIGCRESEAKRTMGRNGSSGDVSFSFI